MLAAIPLTVVFLAPFSANFALDPEMPTLPFIYGCCHPLVPVCVTMVLSVVPQTMFRTQKSASDYAFRNPTLAGCLLLFSQERVHKLDISTAIPWSLFACNYSRDFVGSPPISCPEKVGPIGFSVSGRTSGKATSVVS